MKAKGTLLANVGDGSCKNKFLFKKAEFPDVEKCLLKWFRETHDKNIPLSGLMLKKRALAYATSLGHQDFKASDGWLGNYEKRYKICGKSVCGESGSVNDDVC